jgi:hypothetical protein
MKTKTISFFPLVGDFAEDKDQAATIREQDIRPVLAGGGKVVLDFAGISLATQSFVHALISDLLRTGGERILDKLEFHGCVPSVRGIIETVVQYSLDSLEAPEKPEESA